jgi:hydroxymethylglutaryl-CoA lyase
MQLPDHVTLVEVSPRDGLQNEALHVPAQAKIEFIDKLSRAGMPVVEITSCVSARWIPQLADHSEVIRGIERVAGVRYPVLVPNLRGLEDAIKAGATEVSIIASASESFSEKNSNCSIGEGLVRCGQIIEKAKQHNLRARGYVSCTLGCPYEGAIPQEQVVQVSTKLLELGCPEIVLSDTIGVGTPIRVQSMLNSVSQRVPVQHLAVHFHDTYGQALANILAALEVGIKTVDCSVAGLGGCPYASGATGNVASEDLLYMLNGLGITTGVDLEKLIEAGEYICRILKKSSRSKVALAYTKVQQ